MADAPRPTQPPAHIAPFVRVLGEDGAVEFLLNFGGAELYLSDKPRAGSRLVEAVGLDKAAELARASDRLPRRIPTAKPWIATRLKARGLSTAEIARKLHASDVAVRGWLKKSRAAEAADPRQPSLF